MTNMLTSLHISFHHDNNTSFFIYIITTVAV